jgi:hypothetical protein
VGEVRVDLAAIQRDAPARTASQAPPPPTLATTAPKRHLK